MSHEIIDGELIDAADRMPIVSPPQNVPVQNVLIVPNAPVRIRVATMADMAAIDSLQKKNSRALGFFPRQQLAGYLNGGWVLVAEATETGVSSQKTGEMPEDTARSAPVSCLRSPASSVVGYVISRDRYMKRDELGCVFQMCVSAEAQRQQVAATLLREVFERASYGCRLFCCWCAQDLTAANRFWESMGFIPLAFRAGSRSKDRAHIFWQKRIRAGDESTPWWFPACTGGGALREDRIVLPIPPGVKWSDPIPRLLPEAPKRLTLEKPRAAKPLHSPGFARNGKPVQSTLNGLSFAPAKETEEERKARRKAMIAERRKLTPEQAATARELRDRFLENANEGTLSLTVAVSKYDVRRQLAGKTPAMESPVAQPLLAA
jgi:ribosomal protein S18 acetylase RimI-like enzyme